MKGKLKAHHKDLKDEKNKIKQTFTWECARYHLNGDVRSLRLRYYAIHVINGFRYRHSDIQWFDSEKLLRFVLVWW